VAIAYLFSIVVWLLVAYLVGRRARKRGFSFWAYFSFALLRSFILALVTLGIADRMASEKESKSVQMLNHPH